MRWPQRAGHGIQPHDVAILLHLKSGERPARISASDRARPEFDVRAGAGAAPADVAALGGLMGTTAKVRGMAGMVLDAGVRDLAELLLVRATEHLVVELI